MYIETDRLIIRELIDQEAEVLLEISRDKLVKKYHSTFFENSTMIKVSKVIFNPPKSI